ncbi:divalent metal cation transporter MntH [Alicyclobacillus contaminans]|uniref:Nramp family divalent metal transporter n=1 Tax=Alicyclobacillus contaminans TaxID=392016 RepID=UPI00041AFFD3|nr:Nramp family divalent metal transporter [Alicyclobacillus contaminans]GMA51539.1 divalent metal cation transporter MntH [Alicyclobacillus contaminans]
MSQATTTPRPRRADLRAVAQAQRVLDGRQRGLKSVLPFLGPALIAAIAYVDPGNFATNIQSGSEFGYQLLWVVVLANLMAMVLQNLSAKLGIATGRNLPELCREHFPVWVNVILWIISEVAAMATDLAEFLGASLALNLLCHIPLLMATLVTALATMAILAMDRLGFRPIEMFIGALLGVIALCYLLETIFSGPDWSEVAIHAVTPWIGNHDSVMLVVGIIGATVMPHAIYLHSGLTQNRVPSRTADETVRIYRYQRLDVVLAMVGAGLVNMAIMYMSASVFHHHGQTDIADITVAYHTLTPLLGGAASAVFLISLLASGLSSSAVGTMAGQLIMQGFVGFQIPVWVRRVVTMLPTVIVVAMGINPTQTLVLSQVVLSLALPAPVITLIYFTSRRSVMGRLVNARWMTALALVIACCILALNGVYLWMSV